MAQFTEKQVFDIIDEEAKNLDIPVIVDLDVPLNLYLEYLGTVGSIMGFANAIDSSIHMFLNPLMSMIENSNKICSKMGFFGKLTGWYRNPEKLLRGTIRGFLIHEGRHIEQYNYLKEKGVDLKDYFEQSNKTNYWLRKHEIDAYLVQYFGIRLPLSWLF